MKRYFILLLSLLLLVSISLVSCGDTTDPSESKSQQTTDDSKDQSEVEDEFNDYEDDIDPDNIMGTALTDPAYRLQLSSAETYTPGEEVVVIIKVKDIALNDGFVFYNFFLYYDGDKVEPVVKNDGLNENMDKFLKVSPDQERWEGMSRLEEETNRYDISFFTAYDSPSKDDDSIVIEIPFMVKGDADGTITFELPHGRGSALDYPLNEYKGNGSSIDVNKG